MTAVELLQKESDLKTGTALELFKNLRKKLEHDIKVKVDKPARIKVEVPVNIQIEPDIKIIVTENDDGV